MNSAERLGKTAVAARAFSAPDTEAAGDADNALELLASARIALFRPNAAPALLYAQALLRRHNDAKNSRPEILEPFAANWSWT